MPGTKKVNETAGIRQHAICCSVWSYDQLPVSHFSLLDWNILFACYINDLVVMFLFWETYCYHVMLVFALYQCMSYWRWTLEFKNFKHLSFRSFFAIRNWIHNFLLNNWFIWFMTVHEYLVILDLCLTIMLKLFI